MIVGIVWYWSRWAYVSLVLGHDSIYFLNSSYVTVSLQINKILKDIIWMPFATIIMQTKEEALLLTDIILKIRLTCNYIFSISSLHLVNIKLEIIFLIPFKMAHQNNSNYFLLFIILHLHLADAQVNILTFFNHLNLCVSYDILQKKPRNITTSSIFWIKQQNITRKLIRNCNNFKYCENIYEKRLNNSVKFCLVYIALWIKKNLHISATSLQQCMWNLKHNLLKVYNIFASIFGMNCSAI